jgi:molybdenum cofactor cytidylyltransferase
MNYGVAILAAGKSERMGSPKMLLPWGESTVLGQLVQTWRSLNAAQIAVVHAANDSQLWIELNRLGIAPADRIANPNRDSGMFGSIRGAAGWSGWKRSLSHVVLALGDQPHLPTGMLRSLLAFAEAEPTAICQPSHFGRPKHPLVLPRELFQRLADAPGATMRDFLAAHSDSVRTVEFHEAALDVDLDRPEDYERALRDWSGCR